MDDIEKDKIRNLLKEVGREDLLCKHIFLRSYYEVKKVLELPQWHEYRFMNLLTSSVWQSNVNNTKAILELPEWDNPKNRSLLTPSIWSSKAKYVKEILAMPEWKNPKFKNLLTSTIWERKPAEIREILAMPEWNDPDFKRLLTPNVWVNTPTDLKKKLHLPYWQEPRYKHLLAPSMCVIALNTIIGNIQLFEEYGISDYINSNSIRRNPREQRGLIKYILDNGMDLVVEAKSSGRKFVHPILRATKSKLSRIYKIDANEIADQYDGIRGI